MATRGLVGAALGVSLGALVGAAVVGGYGGRINATALGAGAPADDRAGVAHDVLLEREAEAAAEPAAPPEGSRHFVQELEWEPLRGGALECEPIAIASTTKWIQVEFASVELQASGAGDLSGFRAFLRSERVTTGQRLVPIKLAGTGDFKWGSAEVLLFHGPEETHPKLSVCVEGPPTVAFVQMLAIVTGYTFTP